LLPARSNRATSRHILVSIKKDRSAARQGSAGSGLILCGLVARAGELLNLLVNQPKNGSWRRRICQIPIELMFSSGWFGVLAGKKKPDGQSHIWLDTVVLEFLTANSWLSGLTDRTPFP
jgi:hypothetical protein